MVSKFVILLLAFGFINTVNSEERVDMVCTSNYSLEVVSGKFEKLTPSDHSLVIFPKSQRYIYNNHSDSYSLKNNKLVYTTCEVNHILKNNKLGNDSCSDAYMKSVFSVDRTTGVYKEHWYTMNKLALIFTGKCKKTENLF